MPDYNKINIKLIFIKIVCIVGAVAACSLLATLLLIGVYLLPNGHMIINTLISADELSKDQGWVYGIFEDRTQKDMFTDALILRKSVFGESGHPVRDAMEVPSYKANGSDSTARLKLSAERTGQKNGKLDMYPRYWHGYLILIKPLLIFFNITQIYTLNAMVIAGLIIVLFVMVYSRIGIGACVSLFAALSVVNPISAAGCLQYSPVLIISVLSMIIILKCPKNLYMIIFLANGILTAFFDLLTYPLVTLGMPLVLAVTLDCLEMYDPEGASDRNTGNLFLLNEGLKIAKASLIWSFAYGGMWFMKWLIAGVVTGDNVIADAVHQILFRTSGAHKGLDISFAGALRANFSHICTPQFLAFVLAIVVCIIIRRVYNIFLRQADVHMADISFASYGYVIYKVIPFLIVAVYPIMWYALLKNHSVIHNWFTYKNLSIFVYAIFSGMNYVIIRLGSVTK